MTDDSTDFGPAANDFADPVRASLSGHSSADDPVQRRGRSRSYFAGGLGVAHLLLIFSFAVFLFRAAPTLTFPFEFRYGESILLDDSIRVHGREAGAGVLGAAATDSGFEDFYTPLDQWPFLFSEKPPVFAWLVGWLPFDIEAPFFWGRLVSIASVLGCALVIYLFSRRHQPEPVAVSLTALYLALPNFAGCAHLFLEDSLALFLGLSGLLMITGPDPKESSWRSALAPGLLLVASFLVDFLMLPLIAVSLALGFNTHRSRAATASVIFLVTGLAFWLLAGLLSKGLAWQHAATYLSFGFSWTKLENVWLLSTFPWGHLVLVGVLLAIVPRLDRLAERSWYAFGFAGLVFLIAAFVYTQLGLEYWQTTVGERQPDLYLGRLYLLLGLALAGGLIALLPVGSDPTKNRERVVLGILVTGAIVSGGLSGLFGAYLNYLYQYDTLLVLALATSRFSVQYWQRVLVTLILATGILGHLYTFEPVRPTRADQREEIAKGRRPLLKALVHTEGPLLTEDPSFAAQLRRPVQFHPEPFMELYRLGEWDLAPVEQAIRQGEFGAILLVRRLYSNRLEKTESGELIPKFEGRPLGDRLSLPPEFNQVYPEKYRLLDRLDETVSPLAKRAYYLFLRKRR